MQRTLTSVLASMATAAVLVAGCSPAAAPATTPAGGSGAPAAQAPAQQPAAAANPVDSVALDKSKPTEIMFWHRQTAQSEEAQNKLIDEFNRTNEWGIKVKAETVGDYTKLYQKIIAAIQAKAVPDFAAAYESMSAEYYEANAAVPFDDYINSKKYGLSEADQKDLVPAYMDATKFEQYENKRLTFPYTKSALVLYTNLDNLKKIGATKPAATWDEFLDHCRKAVAAIGKCYAMSVDTSTADGFAFTYGGDVISKDGKTAWGSAEALKALKLYETLAKEKLAHQIQGNDDQADIAGGKALYMVRSSTSIPFVLQQIGDKSKLAVSILPQGSASAAPKTVLFGGNVSIMKTTPEKQLASWLFIKWLANKDITARWTLDSSNGYFPLRQSALAEPSAKKFFDDNPHFAAAFEASKAGKVEPSNKGWQEVRIFVADAVTGIVTGKMTAEQAQKDIMDKSKRALGE